MGTLDGGNKSSSQELLENRKKLPKYTEQERQLNCQLTFPEGVRVQAVFQQQELRRMSARARPRVTLRIVLVLFAELLFLYFGHWISKVLRPPLLKGPARDISRNLETRNLAVEPASRKSGPSTSPRSNLWG